MNGQRDDGMDGMATVLARASVPLSRHPVIRLGALTAAALAMTSCELTETTIPAGEPVVIVQSVVSRTRGEQWVLLEYSLTGNVPRGPTGSLAPPQSPRLPISGAFVTVEHLGPGSCAGRVDTLVEAPVVTPGAVASGVYTWQVQCAYDPRDRLRLTVRTPAGEIVRGETSLPGAQAYLVSVGTSVAQFPLDELRMNRLTDTLKIGLVPTLARAMQVEVRRAENQEEVAIYAFTDTLGIRFAGNLINPFEGDSGESVFRAGRYYLVTVAATDSNYYDFIRSRSDPLTGRGYLNHLEGGIGVFGSVEARSWLLAVTAPQADPREGRYAITGMARGAPVDLTLDVYLDELDANPIWDVFSAFVEGTFFLGSVRRSGDGFFGVDGGPDAGAFAFGFDVPTASGLRRMELFGQYRGGSTPFQVQLGDANGVDTLTMRRLP